MLGVRDVHAASLAVASPVSGMTVLSGQVVDIVVQIFHMLSNFSACFVDCQERGIISTTVDLFLYLLHF